MEFASTFEVNEPARSADAKLTAESSSTAMIDRMACRNLLCGRLAGSTSAGYAKAGAGKFGKSQGVKKIVLAWQKKACDLDVMLRVAPSLCSSIEKINDSQPSKL